MLDEIQMVETINNPYLPKETGAKISFVDVLLGLKSLPNVDVYVTGSNSKMLSSEVATTFRDRGEEIHITPLTYEKFYAAYPHEKRYAWREFMTYGGLLSCAMIFSHGRTTTECNISISKIFC